MRPRRRFPALTVRFTLLLLAATLAPGCENSGFGGLTGKADSGGKSTDTDTDTKVEAGDEPAEVSGAFLCGPAGDYTAPEGEVSYGCAVRRKDSDEKLPGAATDPKATLTVEGLAAVDLPTYVAPPSSSWHYFFTVPSDTLTKKISLSVAVNIGSVPFSATLDSLDSQIEILIGVDENGEVCNCPDTSTATGSVVTDPESLPMLSGMRVLFVTKDHFTPGHATLSHRFLGATGTKGSADARCAEAAADADDDRLETLGFVALIGSQGVVIESMLDDGVHDIQSTNGQYLGRTEMLSDKLGGPIRDEFGDLPNASDRAWTGVHRDGTTDNSDNCSDWTTNDSGEVGEVGVPAKDDENWYNDGSDGNGKCNGEDKDGVDVPTHLYCLSTLPVTTVP